MSSVDIFLIGTVGFLLCGIIAEFAFRRFQIPDALWLITIGIFLGPITGWVDAPALAPILPYFAAVALTVILFDGGSKLSLPGLRDAVGRASILAISSFSITVLAVALMSWLGVLFGVFSEWTWFKALLIGSIVGGSSSIIVMPTMLIGKVKEQVANLVSLESAATDALSIVGASLLLTLAATSDRASFREMQITGLLTQTVGVGLIGGLIAGLLWLLLMPFLKGPFRYALTLSFLFVLYVVIGNLNGSAAFAILIFAIVVGNARLISRMMKLEGRRKLTADVNFLSDQLAFIVKTFFFLLVGVLATFSFTGILMALLLSLAIVAARWPATKLALLRSDYDRSDERLVQIAMPRGLAAGVLATMPLQARIAGTERLSEVVFLIVTMTTIMFSVLFFMTQRKRSPITPIEADSPEGTTPGIM